MSRCAGLIGVLIFKIIGKIEDIENIAAGASIRDRRRLRKVMVAADGES